MPPEDINEEWQDQQDEAERLEYIYEKRRIKASNYKSLLPKIQKIYAGYSGLNGGICILWNRRIFILIKPINERT